ncbi:hypothetical protein IEO21_06470 [Rhodonia placenta]|uniref:ABC transporter domain-containing protein n=1 Tax=Rhodonia placenta TaxID=104341 RepID=A0A8H7U1B2_9APHY|nr:hypothetical protein IEO21_06470 [Postia placenta]
MPCAASTTCSRRRIFQILSLKQNSVRCYSASLSDTLDSPTRTILHLPNASIFERGHPITAEPVLRDISWTIQPGEAWAILSAGHGSSKRTLFHALLGQRRIHPFPRHGLFPFLGQRDPAHHVRLVSFSRETAGGAFFDYTARYGAVRDEDRLTLREVYFPESARPLHELAMPELHHPETKIGSQESPAQALDKRKRFEELVDALRLQPLLDLPVIALSNGQTRRARIAKALLQQPLVLLLDEPLTGLDVETRALMLEFLRSQHTSADPKSPHVVLGMRPKDPLPAWITHVALVTPERGVLAGPKEELALKIDVLYHQGGAGTSANIDGRSVRQLGHELVRMSGLNVKYGNKHVLKDIDWTVQQNSRWQLMGANGAGKTTLLAMLTGEHPQSFAQSAQLQLFGKPRAGWPAAQLNARIGRVSPELASAFPRKHGMTAWDVVGTGFTGEFVPRGKLRVGVDVETGSALEPGSAKERWRVERMWQVLEGLGPRAWAGRIADGSYEAAEDTAFAQRQFVDLGPGEQAIVLLMRALVGRPPLVLLDEVWAGMDEGMIQAVWRYLADGAGGLLETQACVVISHWEDEVPWGRADGVRRFLLKDGAGCEVE